MRIKPLARGGATERCSGTLSSGGDVLERLVEVES